MRHFLTLDDFSKDEILQMINLAREIKSEAKAKIYKPYLKDQILAMIFEKSSTRTRVSFEVGMHQLGGKGMFLSANDLQIGRGEPIKDTARVISSMSDMAMLRVNKHETLEEFAKFSKVPVINGLSDKFHPVQLMADYLTMLEFSSGEKVAYVGDGNNITHSWLMLASKLGFELRIATPKGYEPDAQILEKAIQNAKLSGAKIYLTEDIKEAVSGADVVTTDTWVSMGQEDEKDRRIKDFEGFCVDENLMKLAKNGAIFLHCLPAYRGYEVSEAVFEAHADEIFAEAENRLHAQKGIMVWLNKNRK
ncbi:ornithine carbamoyltransferase [Campylobacter sp. CCUG 57310]|uniref:ornithine carbamoyltransferase n=1 Tax=Campylobacter sp. CCUG 57310 TaxID=2517362 RepID=UPI00156586F3|nr:ornithine carbamoyltransferase [Campylobacter sp. CCUG 57310]QKF92701.1 ornithine carbamoyltransferase [Campylobacter sp. CCUG 57310]